MAMNKPLFDIDIPGMEATLNKFQPGNGFVWAQLFPLKYTYKFDLQGIEGEDGIPVAADRVAFNTRAPQKTRRTIGKWSGKLSKYAVKRTKDELEINDFEIQSREANLADTDKQAKQEIIRVIYDDVNFCRQAMDAKVEIDAMRIATSGVQDFPAEIEGDMAQQDVINFNIPAENFRGVTTAWSNAETADGIKDIIEAQRMITKQGKAKPRFAFMEQEKFQELIAQKATARRLFPRVNDLSAITSDMVTLSAVNAYMGKAENGFPQIIVLDTYSTIEKKDGTRTTIKPWNVNVVVLSATAQLGWTYYKPVPQLANVAALQTYGSFFKVTRYSNVEPLEEVTMAEAYVQPALINRQSLVLINTTRTAWNGGAKAVAAMEGIDMDGANQPAPAIDAPANGGVSTAAAAAPAASEQPSAGEQPTVDGGEGKTTTTTTTTAKK